jgi:hypothetical protein
LAARNDGARDDGAWLATSPCSGASTFVLLRSSLMELVAQIFPRWNRLQPWFELIEAFKDAA